MGHVGIVAVHPTWSDDSDGHPIPLHGPDLHRRGMSAQQIAIAQIEGVVHGPGRVIFRDIQGCEVVVLVLHFRPRGHGKAGLRENRLHASQSTRHRMQRPHGLAATIQCDVKDVPPQLRSDGCRLQLPLPGPYTLLKSHLLPVDGLTRGGPLGRRQMAEGLQLRGQQALLAQVFDAHLVQTRQVGGRPNSRVGLLYQFSQVAHVRPPSDSGARRTQLSAMFLAGQRGFRLLGQYRKRIRILDCKIRQNFSIDLVAGLFQAVDHATVGQAVQARPGVDSGNPQRPKLAFALAPVPIGVLTRFGDRLLGDSIDLAAGSVIAP